LFFPSFIPLFTGLLFTSPEIPPLGGTVRNKGNLGGQLLTRMQTHPAAADIAKRTHCHQQTLLSNFPPEQFINDPGSPRR
jgi:hypothetical protein